MAVVVRERKVVVAAGERLADLARADFAGSAGHDAAELRRRVVGGQHERVGEEGVAEKHRRVGAVGAVGGVAAVARIGAVEDVVMDQRGEVDEFDDAGAADQGGRGRAAGARAEGEERTESLAGMGEHVADHRADFGFEREFLLREEMLEGREMGFKADVQRGGHAAMCG